MAIDYLPVSWNEYHSSATKLATRILSDDVHIDEIVAISRGGLTLGHLLTDLLRVPISTFSIQSYADIQNQGVVKITKPLTTPIHDKHILLVDDISDTGRTLLRALEYLKAQQPKNVTTTTLFYRPTSIYKPDYFAKSTSVWIKFPYELTETAINVIKKMKKDGESDAQIERTLHKLKYDKESIIFVKKFYS